MNDDLWPGTKKVIGKGKAGSGNEEFHHFLALNPLP
jgi:hypothetical protein